MHTVLSVCVLLWSVSMDFFLYIYFMVCEPFVLPTTEKIPSKEQFKTKTCAHCLEYTVNMNFARSCVDVFNAFFISEIHYRSGRDISGPVFAVWLMSSQASFLVEYSAHNLMFASSRLWYRFALTVWSTRPHAAGQSILSWRSDGIRRGGGNVQTNIDRII